ncbi:MAG: sulfatase-like hydrolase/transferase [Acidobacteria bacterium]|nr:sulfatase-like hydrolase/transferase [Acidobacteriota bacterium]
MNTVKMITPPSAPTTTWRRAAMAGFVAWAVFAAIEAGLEVALRFLPVACSGIPLRWNYPLVLLAVYAPIGAALGTAAFGALRVCRKSVDQHRRIAELCGAVPLLLAVAGVSWLQYGMTLNGFVVPALVLIIAAFGVVEFVRPRLGAVLSGFATPWMSGILLLGVPWLVRQATFGTGRFVRVAATLSFLVAVTAAVVTPRLAGSRASTASATSPLRHAVGAATVAAVSVLVAWIGLPVVSSFTPAADPRLPNVILVTLDTVRADHLSLYGYERDTTPRLRQLARDATVYRRAIAPSDLTLSTHASMFTGLYATWHGAHAEGPGVPHALAETHYTLAERLRDKGYSTAEVVANFGFLGPQFRLQQGFGYYTILTPSCCVTSPSYLYRYARAGGRIRVNPVFPMTSRAGEVNGEVFTLLDVWSRRRAPFFLFVDYMDAHWPYFPPAPFDRAFPGKDEAFRLRHFRRLLEEVNAGKRHITEKERAHLLSQYDGAITYLDQEVGRLVDHLRAKDLYDNTLLVITSDHGEAFGDRDLIEHGTSVYQDQVHVPLLVKLPHRPAARATDEAVSTLDVMPTILEVVGAEPARPAHGRSLLGDDERPLGVMSESYAQPQMFTLSPRFRRVERAIFDGAYKYVTSSAGKRELYHLDRDPAEREDLATTEGSAAQRLQAAIDGWVVAANRAAPPRQRMDDPDARQRLRSLGYVR